MAQTVLPQRQAKWKRYKLMAAESEATMRDSAIRSKYRAVRSATSAVWPRVCRLKIRWCSRVRKPAP